MKKEFIDKLKEAVKGNEAAFTQLCEAAGKLSFEELENVAGGREAEEGDKEAIYWLLDNGMATEAWTYLELYFGISGTTKSEAIRVYGFENGVRYVVEHVLHL